MSHVVVNIVLRSALRIGSAVGALQLSSFQNDRVVFVAGHGSHCNRVCPESFVFEMSLGSWFSGQDLKGSKIGITNME